jgi:hypothetical protein
MPCPIHIKLRLCRFGIESHSMKSSLLQWFDKLTTNGFKSVRPESASGGSKDRFWQSRLLMVRPGMNFLKLMHRGPKYLVQVAIPTIYVIDARSPLRAMDKAGKRFQQEHNMQLEPEFQWAELKGAATDDEWRIADWGELRASVGQDAL